jgi:hypothetical protein
MFRPDLLGGQRDDGGTSYTSPKTHSADEHSPVDLPVTPLSVVEPKSGG